MMTSFYKAFADSNEDRVIPQEVLDELNKSLPENLMYKKNKSGYYTIVPIPDDKGNIGRITLQPDFDRINNPELISRLKIVPSDKLIDFLYRSQLEIPVKSLKIGTDQKKISMAQMNADPFSDGIIEPAYTMIVPGNNSSSFKLKYESREGESETLTFRQSDYNNLKELKFSNVNFPALRIEMFVYSPLVEDCDDLAKTSSNNPIVATCSVHPTNANSVSDALKALHIFSGMFDGTTKINGLSVGNDYKETKTDFQWIQDSLEFWSTAHKLEEKLGVSFKPSAEFPQEDAQLFAELKVCLLDGKAINWNHPFDEFNFSAGESNSQSSDIDKIIGSDKVLFRFAEGPIHCKLLGTEFDIFRLTEMRDFIITNIQWNKGTTQTGKAYIVDAPGKKWSLKCQYVLEKDLKKKTID